VIKSNACGMSALVPEGDVVLDVFKMVVLLFGQAGLHQDWQWKHPADFDFALCWHSEGREMKKLKEVT